MWKGNRAKQASEATERSSQAKRQREKKGPRGKPLGPLEKNSWQRPTLPHRIPCSTIGPGGLNYRVRDGIGCGPSGIATRKKEKQLAKNRSSAILNCCAKPNVVDAANPDLQREEKQTMVKPHGRLVLVSFTHYCASTPSLLPRGLRGAFRVLRPGRPNLEDGFPLRCFQRLSIPDVATRRCGWCHNRNTRGQSNPVLSY